MRMTFQKLIKTYQMYEYTRNSLIPTLSIIVICASSGQKRTFLNEIIFLHTRSPSCKNDDILSEYYYHFLLTFMSLTYLQNITQNLWGILYSGLISSECNYLPS